MKKDSEKVREDGEENERVKKIKSDRKTNEGRL